MSGFEGHCAVLTGWAERPRLNLFGRNRNSLGFYRSRYRPMGPPVTPRRLALISRARDRGFRCRELAASGTLVVGDSGLPTKTSIILLRSAWRSAIG